MKTTTKKKGKTVVTKKVVKKAAPVKKAVKKTVKKKDKKEEGNDLMPFFKEIMKPVRQDIPHIVVKALAGTGKTFTEIVGVVWALAPKLWPQFQREVAVRNGADPDTFEIIPSDQQRAVWELMALSREQMNGMFTVTYCAFNKSIVNDFELKWGWTRPLLEQHNVELKFATVNSLGNSTVYQAYGRLNVKNKGYNAELLADVLGYDLYVLRDQEPFLVSMVSDLVTLCKLNMLGWSAKEGFDPDRITEEDLDQLVSHYNIEFDSAATKVRAYQLVPAVIQKSLDFRNNRTITFDDQNWLPLVAKLPIKKYDLLMVDEAQDLPRAKQEFALRSGYRLVLVGDVNQAIYGFAGADPESLPRMEKLMAAQKPVEICSLTQTRRCGKQIVEEARSIVPGFEAHETNPLGEVATVTTETYVEQVDDADMVLCRTNAPLISQALRFVKMGRKVVIRGRDFGKSLINFVKGFKTSDVPELIEAVEHWRSIEEKAESKKKTPSESRLIAIADKADCVMAFCEGLTEVDQVINKINLVFAGLECPQCRQKYDEDVTKCFKCKCDLRRPAGVLMSSVHRAKGLEANTVFILLTKEASMPHPMAKTEWQRQQEYNLKYVAITRAIEKLVWVTENRGRIR